MKALKKRDTGITGPLKSMASLKSIAPVQGGKDENLAPLDPILLNSKPSLIFFINNET
jgi:hypothetical protein